MKRRALGTAHSPCNTCSAQHGPVRFLPSGPKPAAPAGRLHGPLRATGARSAPRGHSPVSLLSLLVQAAGTLCNLSVEFAARSRPAIPPCPTPTPPCPTPPQMHQHAHRPAPAIGAGCWSLEGCVRCWRCAMCEARQSPRMQRECCGHWQSTRRTNGCACRASAGCVRAL